jgi:hypothetical protein
LAVGAQVALSSGSLARPPMSTVVRTARGASVVVGSAPGATGAAIAQPARALAAFRQATPVRLGRPSGGEVEPAGRRAPFNGLPWLPLVTLAGLGAFVLRKIWLL